MVNPHNTIYSFKVLSILTGNHSSLTNLTKRTADSTLRIREAWRAFREAYGPAISGFLKGVGQSIFALSFNLAGLIAGFILASSYDVLNGFKWPLIMFPGLLSVRGAIGGLYAGRLSTALHLGTVHPKFRDNTHEAVILNSSIITLTYISALFLGVVVSFTSIVLYGFSFREVLFIFPVVLSVMGLSLLVISPTTILISILAFLKGLDPDMIVYPIISTIADVVVSLTFTTILLYLSTTWTTTLLVLSAISLLFSGLAIQRFLFDRGDTEYMETIREFVITLICVSIIVNYTGNVLRNISVKIGLRPEVYAIYPAIIDTVGDVGSIIGSTATTKLRLGFIGSSLSDIKGHLREISYGWIGSLVMFVVYSMVSSFIFGSELFYPLVLTALLTNLVVIPIIAFISFSVGIVTFKRGLNPDNFIIPIETSLADSITTFTLYYMIR